MRLHVNLPEGLVVRVDGVRGDVPRSAWVRRAVERELEESVSAAPLEPGESLLGRLAGEQGESNRARSAQRESAAMVRQRRLNEAKERRR